MIILMLYIQRNWRLDTTDAPKWANYLDLRLEFDEDDIFYTRLHDKRDVFDFTMVNFPYISRNIPESPAHGVFDLRLIYVMLGYVWNMKTFCSEDLFWFQNYWINDILHINL